MPLTPRTPPKRPKKAAHINPEVTAVRRGWQKEPLLDGYSWLSRLGDLSIVLALKTPQGWILRGVIEDGDVTEESEKIQPGDLFLKVVTPSRPA